MSDLSLAICRSAPHRAVMGLLAVSQGVSVPAGLIADLKASDPQALANIALVNHVHTVIGAAFEQAPELADTVPRDFQVYLAEMTRANGERNRALLEQLALLGRAFSEAGIKAVALKGCAELLHPTHPDPAWRFVSDIDLLIPEEQLDAALAVLMAMGGTTISEERVLGHDRPGYESHHLPPVMMPDDLAPIELHARIGNDLVDRMLPAEWVLTQADQLDTGLSVPDPATRLTHLIVHGQILHERHALHALYLRDCLDLYWMRHCFDDEVLETSRATFEEVGQTTVFEGFTGVFFAIFRCSADARGPAADRWVRTTLGAFGRPGGRRLRETMSWAANCLWRFVFSPEHRRYYLNVLGNRRRLRQVLGALRTRRGRVR